MNLGIVITCKNLLDYTRQAIESIRTSHPFLLIVVDDFSTDGTKDYLRELASKDERVFPIIDPVTYSLAEKWNLGAEHAFNMGAQAVLICNNDIVFSPATIDALVTRMEKGDVGMVTAHNVRGTIEDADKILKLEVTWEPTEAPHPDFSCFMLSKAAWEKVGKFDEKFIPCYFEDSSYHLKMGLSGVVAITTTAAPYLHYGSRTQNSTPGGLCRPATFDGLREYLRSQFGTVPGEPLYDEITQRPYWELMKKTNEKIQTM